MGRPSKLSDRQWAEIEQRAVNGESVTALAKEFKIARCQVSNRVSKQKKTVKTIVGQIKALPVSIQRSVITLAERNIGTRQNVAIIAHEGSTLAARIAIAARERGSAMDLATATPEDLRPLAAMGSVMETFARVGVTRDEKAPALAESDAPDLGDVMADLRRRLGR